MISKEKAIRGCLVGTAVGDALGLPFEGISPRRIATLCPDMLEHRLFFGRGMISDDTEHAFMVARCLAEHPSSPDAFARALGRRLRWWLAALPAGVGLATLRAGIKLWLGFAPDRSGVFSAGNGPAMRASILGTFFRDRPKLMREYVKRSTLLTHTDPQANTGALAVAYASTMGKSFDISSFFNQLLLENDADADWRSLVAKMQKALSNGMSVQEFAGTIGLINGISGYVYHTVPVALYAWLRYFGDFERIISSVVALGGDTDTVAAIAGGVAGATMGEDAIPLRWREGLCDWPLGLSLLRRTAAHLADLPDDGRFNVFPYLWPLVLCRNIFFITIVLFHGFRRLLPPYQEGKQR